MCELRTSIGVLRSGLVRAGRVVRRFLGNRLMLCRHCREREAKRPRGLCRRCYYQRGVRERYPGTSVYGVVSERVGGMPQPIAGATVTLDSGTQDPPATTNAAGFYMICSVVGTDQERTVTARRNGYRQTSRTILGGWEPLVNLELARDPRRVDWTAAAEGDHAASAVVEAAFGSVYAKGACHILVCGLVDPPGGTSER